VGSVDQLSSSCSSMEKLFFSPVCCSQSLFCLSISVFLYLVLPVSAFPGCSSPLLASDFQFLLVLCADPSADVHASVPSGDSVAALLFGRLHFPAPCFSAVADFSLLGRSTR
jgi:hypothetical protein